MTIEDHPVTNGVTVSGPDSVVYQSSGRVQGNTSPAFVVTAVPAFLLSKVIGKHLESRFIMGSALLLGGVVMGLVDLRKTPWEKLGPDAAGTLARRAATCSR